MKAIILTEMPDCCGNCQFCGQMYNDEFEDWKYWCNAKDKEIPETNDKQKWCPLRPLPKKEYYEIGNDGLPTDIEHATYCNGRNKVIDEITGENDESSISN